MPVPVVKDQEIPHPSQPMKPSVRESFDINDMVDEDGLLLVGDDDE